MEANIYSVSEAFSMQPQTWYVGQSMSYIDDAFDTKRPVIAKIQREAVHDAGDPYDFYVGYSSDGQRLFQIRVQCSTVQFKPSA